MYTIQPYTKEKARRIGVSVRPSSVQGKKIDVFKGDEKVASVGAIGYGDFPTFQKSHGKAYAEERRRAYKKRHQSNRLERGTPGYYADQLLW